MPQILFTEKGVQKVLEGLKVHKAAGPDMINPRILKELAKSLAPTLTYIFQKSYETGTLPDDWRSANIVPVFKKGKKSLESNYRPISLTCVACKIMEHIITSNIMNYADSNAILYHLQHGFRSKRSCETQLLEFITDVVKNLKDRKQTDTLIMDFSKAFDKVGHARLIEKLKFYGITGKTNEWIKAFLMNRKQTVVLDGEKSYEAEVS